MSSHMDLSGRVVAITGGAQGIGLEVGRAAISRGARVALLDVNADAVAAAAASLGACAVSAVADVTDYESLERALDRSAETLSGIDVLVINAGLGPIGSSLDAGDRDYHRRVIDVNVHGCLNTLWAGAPHVIARRGHIVFASSVTAYASHPLSGTYGVSKAAVEMASRIARLDLAPTGVTVGVTHFGSVDTEMVRTFESDDLMVRMEHLGPPGLLNKVAASAAAEALVDGITRRAARTIYPARWKPFYTLRGVTGPLLDAYAVRSRRFARVVIEGRQRDRITFPPPARHPESVG